MAAHRYKGRLVLLVAAAAPLPPSDQDRRDAENGQATQHAAHNRADAAAAAAAARAGWRRRRGRGGAVGTIQHRRHVAVGIAAGVAQLCTKQGGGGVVVRMGTAQPMKPARHTGASRAGRRTRNGRLGGMGPQR